MGKRNANDLMEEGWTSQTPIWFVSGQEGEPISQIPFVCLFASSFYFSSSSDSFSLKSFFPCMPISMPAEKWLVLAHPSLFYIKALWNKGHGVYTISVSRQTIQFYYFVTSKKLSGLCNGLLEKLLELVCMDVFSAHTMKENHNLLFWITKLYSELQIKYQTFILYFKIAILLY